MTQWHLGWSRNRLCSSFVLASVGKECLQSVNCRASAGRSHLPNATLLEVEMDTEITDWCYGGCSTPVSFAMAPEMRQQEQADHASHLPVLGLLRDKACLYMYMYPW
jgi:hypothetical protein